MSSERLERFFQSQFGRNEVVKDSDLWVDTNDINGVVTMFEGDQNIYLVSNIGGKEIRTFALKPPEEGRGTKIYNLFKSHLGEDIWINIVDDESRTNPLRNRIMPIIMTLNYLDVDKVVTVSLLKKPPEEA